MVNSEVIEAGGERGPRTEPSARGSGWATSERLSRWGLFGGLVVAPSLVAAVYYGVVASDIYVSESRFVVRSAEAPDSESGVAAVFKGFSSIGQGNILFVRDYLLSRQMVVALDHRLGVRSRYGRGDLLARFPSPWGKRHGEAFYAYYLKQVRLEVDPESAVAVLTVRGFDPRAVQASNAALLEAANGRIDQLNSDIRKDALTQAERELVRSEAGLRDAEGRLARYRGANGVIDPDRQAVVELQAAQELAGRLVAAEARLAQVESLAPRSPQIPAIQSEVNSLERAVAEVRSKVTGQSQSSRAQMLEAFRALTLERDIAARTVTSTHEALIRARVEAERRHLYLEVVSAPSFPDGALYPKRLRSVVAVFMLGIVCWGVASLVLAGLREHRNAV